MKKVAIVGAGIVGATAAYYLSKEADVEVTVFDHGTAKRPRQLQESSVLGSLNDAIKLGTRWLAWERILCGLLADLEKSGQKVDFYQRSGVLLLKKDDSKLEELYDLALQRRDESPLIGELAILDQAAASSLFPGLEGYERLLYACWRGLE